MGGQEIARWQGRPSIGRKSVQIDAMDILEYTEDVAAKSVEVARSAYDDLHERAYKLATVLVAGGGGIGAFALGRFGAPHALPVEWAPLAGLALSWFGIAALLVVRAVTSKELSPGNGPDNLRNYFKARLAEDPSDPEGALAKTRNAELDLVQARIRGYGGGCTERALAIDGAYRAVAACSPSVPLLIAGGCFWLR